MPTRAMRACSYIAEPQLILCKINNIAHVITIYLTKITYYKLSP